MSTEWSQRGVRGALDDSVGGDFSGSFCSSIGCHELSDQPFEGKSLLLIHMMLLIRAKLERSALGAHSSLGAMIVVSLLAQPIFGYIHHIQFRKYGRTWVSSFHSWLGRVLLASAWINTML